MAKSNISSLQNFNCRINLCGPAEFLPREDSIPKNCYIMDIDEAIKSSDVFMLLRVQHERHGLYEFNVENYNKEYGLNLERVKQTKPDAIIMHPGPINRGVEIDSNLADSKRSVILNQVNNGVFVRMAVLHLCHSYYKSKKISLPA